MELCKFDSEAASPGDPVILTRRLLVAGLLAAYSTSLIPRALAQPAPAADHAAFTALSAFLTGRPALGAAQIARCYDALAAGDPRFSANVQALLSLINERSIRPLQLQAVLDGERSPLAPLPRKIASAWCLGVVGSGEAARSLAFETALNAVIVADVLKPPTYAYGAYASWVSKPI